MKQRLLHPLTSLSTLPQKRRGSVDTKVQKRNKTDKFSRGNPRITLNWDLTSYKPPLQAQTYTTTHISLPTWHNNLHITLDLKYSRFLRSTSNFSKVLSWSSWMEKHLAILKHLEWRNIWLARKSHEQNTYIESTISV